ncbi:MAG: 4-hydroxy-tetrahydrodipicolinate reductase [Acidimicrobiia bacterium]|nr:4-hydroxy-tetrahydrodipicolinate reductase [Acidimicrobiia bacterium]
MIAVAVSGAAGRMGRLVAETVAETDGLDLIACFDPGAPGDTVAGTLVSDEPGAVADADVVVEFTQPDVVIGNLTEWRRQGVHAVVGTSGFNDERLAAVRAMWGDGPPNCIIVPNFSIGAVMMMRLSELAAPHFQAAEVIELHHDKKADAPSGTALNTAARIAAVQEQQRAVESRELSTGARGASVDDVRVHSVRLPGYVAHQEVIFGGVGETLTIRHDTTDRHSFMPGVVLAVRQVAGLDESVVVGLDALLGI